MQLNDLWNYIREHELLSDTEIEYVKTCIEDVTEMSPSDKPMIFRKMERLIEDSDKLSWCIFSVRQQLNKMNKAYKQIKDPDYVTLVRQGRPSSEAINSEVRWRNDSLYDLEEDIATVENIIEYLVHLDHSLEKYNYMLKDKLSIEK